jgi:hypothetical protein
MSAAGIKAAIDAYEHCLPEGATRKGYMSDLRIFMITWPPVDWPMRPYRISSRWIYRSLPMSRERPSLPLLCAGAFRCSGPSSHGPYRKVMQRKPGPQGKATGKEQDISHLPRPRGGPTPPADAQPQNYRRCERPMYSYPYSITRD